MMTYVHARASARSEPMAMGSEQPFGQDGLVGENIICFAGNDWWFHNPHSSLHIMKSLATTNRIVFVNSTGIKMPDFKADRFFWKRVSNKLKSLARYLRKPEQDIYVFTPLALPLIRGREAPVRAINKILLTAQFRVLLALLRFRNPIIWVTALVARDIALSLRESRGKCLIYYCVDNVSQFPGVDTDYMLALERDIQAKAELSLYVNGQLADERREFANDIRIVSHGVDYEHFAKVQHGGLPMPAELTELPRPIVGYIGEVSSLDYDLIRFLAARHPDKSFVFVGDVYSDMDNSPLPGNVHFLGKRQYEDLPAYMQAFDCCCLYYNTQDVFNCYRNPKKLLEYFATGKPIVSVDIPQVAKYSDSLLIGRSYEEFDRCLLKALHSDSREACERRIAIARNHTWDAVARRVGAEIKDILSRVGA